MLLMDMQEQLRRIQEEAMAQLEGVRDRAGLDALRLKLLGKKGVVSKPAVHERVLREVIARAPECGWRVRALDFSPIKGGDGNLEFLADFVPDDGRQPIPDAQQIRELVRRAHEAMRQEK